MTSPTSARWKPGSAGATCSDWRGTALVRPGRPRAARTCPSDTQSSLGKQRVTVGEDERLQLLRSQVDSGQVPCPQVDVIDVVGPAVRVRVGELRAGPGGDVQAHQARDEEMLDP